jgi:hypothetical protein
MKASGAGGGSCFTSWTNRDLNTFEGDNEIASLNGNAFTLQPGTYFVEVQAPAYFVGAHQARLVLAANGADIAYGSNSHSHPSAGSMTTSHIKTRIVITQATSYNIQHRCSQDRPTLGLGVGNSFGGPETFSIVTIQKLK